MTKISPGNLKQRFAVGNCLRHIMMVGMKGEGGDEREPRVRQFCRGGFFRMDQAGKGNGFL